MLLSFSGVAFAGDEPPPAPADAAQPGLEQPAQPEPQKQDAEQPRQQDTEEAQKAQKPDDARENGTREAICLMIESAAAANGLPLEYFARVI
jgi:ADP-heptose:LPS heptosyltransferase